MALTFSKIEAIKFGELEVPPKMDKEQELRVRNLTVDEDNLDEVREVLSGCFGAYASEVKAFMEKNMFLLDYTKLQVYLTQGPSGLESFKQRMDKFVDKELEKSMEKKVNE